MSCDDTYIGSYTRAREGAMYMLRCGAVILSITEVSQDLNTG